MQNQESPTKRDFFSCRSQADFQALEQFLRERTYNLADFEVMSRDKNGCPLIKLGYRTAPDEVIQKRGLIWFTNDTLARIAKPIVDSYTQGTK